MANIIGQSRYCLRLLPHLVPAISSSSRLFSRQLLRQNIRTPGICPVTLPTCACSYSARTPLSANPSAIEDLKMENEEALQTLEAKPEEEEEPRRRRRRSRRSRKKRLITPIQEVGHEFNAEVVPELVSDKRPYVNIDLDHLRQLLFTVNAIDVCVVRVDRQKMHVDYMISCVGKSSRHLESMGTAIAGEYKKKYTALGTTLQVHGSGDWFLLDLGNIIVHFLSQDERERLELEKLWILGQQFDDQSVMFARSNTLQTIF